jgi:membrane peptidoglycan carboxypeptidase
MTLFIQASHAKDKKRWILQTISIIIILVAILAGLVLGIRAYEFAGTTSERVRQTLAKSHSPYTQLNNISPYIQEAAISSQDERFYSNSGIDLKGTARALFYTFVYGQRQGASTITEQLAKNVYFQDIDSLETDGETKALALFITIRYSKKTILELYLNEVIYGPTARGIGKASETYFGVVPDQLTLAQAAYLVGLLNAPGYFADHPDGAVREAKIVLGTMEKDRYITPSQRSAAEAELDTFHLLDRPSTDTQSTHAASN